MDPITTQEIRQAEKALTQQAQKEDILEENIHQFGLTVENSLWVTRERFE